MSRSARTHRMLTLAAGTALASAMLGGCTTQSAPRADISASRADVALKKGNVADAVAHAEAAVLADPRNASYRTTLGAAYMEAGRFLSARTSFDDAMALGDESPRTALGFALAAIATGDRGSAIEVLDDWQDDIPAGDLGLAFALAGDTARGVQILSNAVRGGDNTPKTRQNLAYALALNGNWAGARIMAAQDVPADQLDARISQWAAMAQPEETQARVASLLGTRAVADGGQPAQLALANTPSHQQLVAEAAALAVPAPVETRPVAVANAVGELPPLPIDDPAPVGSAPAIAAAAVRADEAHDFEDAFVPAAPTAATPARMMAAAVEFVSKPVVQSTAPRAAKARPVAGRSASSDAHALAAGNHLVQLGSFSSEAAAERAWGIYAKRFPQLSELEMVITKAVVRGKTYYRVSAGGLARAEAGSFCSSARRQGQGCYAWAEGTPMPGAVDAGVRMARR
ncbi:SPOR domain-containing protein [Tsuneonella sp. YG55]|uniref:SPOR domain-containing protein n=1 Tax=Tsuneonella litorea TaxID=2976475 RepID=A0A9X2W0K3_9SPHN|nr:SPOR domain-containing protein [Tsuneonella litorea]MCT2558905.1 SPOR domain-containing protein [Tsuneonella litorea]